MSSNYWQIKKQSEQYKHGNTTKSKIESYIKVWENRCYQNGIPEEIQHKLMKTCRAPSYKQLALIILKNDLMLKELGFSGKESSHYMKLKELKKKDDKFKWAKFRNS